jgi:hypothetical protein
LTVVVVAFYTRTTNNYGGGAQGARWFFWLIPLWLLMLPAGVRLFARNRLGRFMCYVLLAVSLFTVFWALPHRDDHERKVDPPWSDSWAHLMFRQSWMPEDWRIRY